MAHVAYYHTILRIIILTWFCIITLGIQNFTKIKLRIFTIIKVHLSFVRRHAPHTLLNNFTLNGSHICIIIFNIYFEVLNQLVFAMYYANTSLFYNFLILSVCISYIIIYLSLFIWNWVSDFFVFLYLTASIFCWK